MMSSWKDSILQEDGLVELLREHLKKRSEVTTKRDISILMDLTYVCNLNCVGCGVDAEQTNRLQNYHHKELTTSQFYSILDNISQVLSPIQKKRTRLCFGGGEPLLRGDLTDILSHAAGCFSSENIVLDTNGTLLDKATINAIGPYLNKIEFGFEGLEAFYNDWRNPRNKCGPITPYEALCRGVKLALSWSDKKLDIEMVFLPLRNNLYQFRKAVTHWVNIGIRKFSIHRCMPTGRMSKYPHLQPLLSDYIFLFKEMSHLQNEHDIQIHMHHSIEHILSSALFGEKLGKSGNPLCPIWRSTLTVDAYGYIHFCPWAVSGNLRRINFGKAEYSNLSQLVQVLETENSAVEQDGAVSGCPLIGLLSNNGESFDQKDLRRAGYDDLLLNELLICRKENSHNVTEMVV